MERGWLKILSGMMVTVFAAVVLFSYSEDWAKSIPVGVLLSGFSAIIGGILGFLFAIPRSLQGGVEENVKLAYVANTNLEQISDWLGHEPIKVIPNLS